MNRLLLLVLGLCHTLSYSTVSGSEEQGLSDKFILDAFNEAKRLVDDSYLYSRQKSLERVRNPRHVKLTDSLRMMKQPSRQARQAVRAADYMEQTLRIITERHRIHKRSINATALLTPEQLQTIVDVTGCAAQTRPPSCTSTPNLNQYRTITGVCNNLKYPLQGASNTPFARWTPPIYEDGISQPKGWNSCKLYNGFPLPLVRLVSNHILKTQEKYIEGDSKYTFLLTFYGQWNDHDLTFTPMSPSIRSFSNGIDCDVSCEQAEPCFPIRIPQDDPRVPFGPKNCLPFFRSAPACGSGDNAYVFGGVANQREQINTRTAYLDASQVYGSEEGLARFLRNLSSEDGLMRVNDRFRDNGRELVPFTKVNTNMCATRNPTLNTVGLEEVPCFTAGDDRVVENIALTSIHTLFLREHNRVARALRAMNPLWSSEQLYQETRKILGAYFQVILFRDYLPKIVGTEAISSLLGQYPGYDPDVNPSITSAFSSAAFRFAHATLQPYIFRSNENFKENEPFGNIPLHTVFFSPWRVIFEGGIDPLLRGLISHPAKLNKQDGVLVSEVRDKLFAFTTRIAQDLGSLNMQRSRDHGLKGYNDWRRFCGLSAPQNVDELAEVLKNKPLAEEFIKLYGTPENIDLWVGGITEPFVDGGRVGPLFACIISRQFKNIRQGDRFWWEKPGVFTPAQKKSLTSVSLSRIICDNTGITRVPPNPFLYSPNQESFVSCDTIPKMNLNPWKDMSTF